ncbi:hypothetical protein D7Z54_22325 [Salibacterium salarium]|uniref:YhfM-like domain-containing protein n=1 Tax=Salibacterium salarium TaxID=284579 RepID=A0A428MY24_9BACI|nr:hypothetical protein [Salibacterium salarium]RSL31058.1 hypothetical protein D7Z54_22325 [Salibacterium salarium]
MKKSSLLSVILSTVLIASGCNSEKMATASQSIQKVSAAESNSFGGGNQDFALEFTEQEEIEAFEKMIKSAKKQNVDVAAPTYDLSIDYGEGEKGGERMVHLAEKEDDRYVLMYIGHENETYVASKKSTEPVKDLLEQ